MKPGDETDRLEGIAIIGMSARFPGAPSINHFWRNLCDGVESVTTFTDAQLLSAGEDPALLSSPGYVKAGILLEGVDLFDADFFGFTPREAEATDPEHRVFLECAWEALENAGYDPDQYAGRIGVFAGAGMHCYYQHILASNPDSIRLLGDLQRFIGLEKDFLTTRVSYKLNLKGPSISVQTACSTSLVAVHLGCQSLLNGESDMVLAGGVTIRIPQIKGYLYQEGSIHSPDGHCRAFDAMAQGTTFGSGAGIVVLKRLADAQSDGDCIRAVIIGSCVNNDGAAKIGYTAPSVDGQASVIAEAQALADVTADEVTYVETHGTGTSLGDPIEIAALTKAFRKTTQNKGFCTIGSVKTNVGHLDAAAGVAGLIKVVLALENRTLPPSLNFKQPNPAIDFPNSPFYVQQSLSEWQPSNGRRIAGVSSFGIGGTNAHVIVEEAPPAVASDASRSWQLLPISGRTPAALEKGTDRLAEFLASHRELNLADVAFTLQEGRKAFVHRRILAAKDMEDAINFLQTRDPKRVRSGRAFEGDAMVAFMFPAQGAQHVNMGRDLYDTERVFREHIDRCVEHLQPQLGLDLRKILYPEDKDAEAASEQLRQTRFTQPAVFTVDYALAQLWMSWGVTPAAMVGHSLGEYVAATLSGVFELEDALALVAERARLMQELPPGSMLAVHLSENELRPYLRGDVSLAAVNAPQLSVVSGPTEAIERLVDTFQAKSVGVQPLQTSHAFHSATMEPIVLPFVEEVARVRRRPPRIPFVSTLTGTWITADEAVDPGYWGRQIRCGVRFSPAVMELLKTPGRVLLEVGPGNTLSTLAKLHLGEKTQCTVVNSLRHAKGGPPDLAGMLTALGSLWVAGFAVDWRRLYIREHRRRVPLPTYPFERKRFWIDAREVGSGHHAGSGTDEGLVSRDLPHVSGKIEHGDGSFTEEGGMVTAAGASFYSRPDVTTDLVAPQTETENALAKIWQEALGIREVGIDDDFFELGGESLLAVTILSKVERVFGKRLPLASLIQAPTIHQFAQLVGEKSSKASWSSLVTLNAAGSKPALFLMHSHGGNILEYHPLAHRLGKERPVYALQARGLDGAFTEEPRVEEMASYYLKEIRSMQPHGPYYLGGFCFGGFLALEAAQQLRAQNESVALLIMIDSSTSDYPKYPPATTPAHRVLYSGAYRLALEWSSLWAKPFRKMPTHMLARGRRLKEVSQARAEMLLESVLHRHFRNHSITYQLERLAMTHDRAWAAYNPKPYDGKVLLLYARRQPLGIHLDPTLGWNGLLAGELQVQEVPGFRQNMLDEPNVGTLASAILNAVHGCESQNVISGSTQAA
jgi:acyl transferase domain-containing protein/thioesterase domain-containing protein